MGGGLEGTKINKWHCHEAMETTFLVTQRQEKEQLINEPSSGKALRIIK